MIGDGKRRVLTFDENLERLPIAFERGVLADSRGAISAIQSSSLRSCVVIGSGASYSASIFISKFLESYLGIPARAKTPFEYYSGASLSEGVILVSAGGKNQDILAALDKALVNETRPLVIVTSNADSPLMINATGYPYLFSIVTNSISKNEKEGFFGVQSLIATLGVFISLTPALREPITKSAREWCAQLCDNIYEFFKENHEDVLQIAEAEHVVSLGTGWALPSLIDFESKCVEGGLGWIEISESKNFTHGRFVNSLRRRQDTAVVLFATNDSTAFLNAFRDSYGSTFSILPIISKTSDAIGGFELFIYAFYLFKTIATIRNVRVSCPEIPDQARRMFRGDDLYTNLVARERTKHRVDLIVDIKRQLLRKNDIAEVEIERMVPKPVVAASVANLLSTEFKGFICDYDGTLVSIQSRDETVSKELIAELERLLDNGINIGIVTGRGMSVVENLQSIIPSHLYKQVYCYLNNGGVLIRLDRKEPLFMHELKDIEAIEQQLNGSLELAKYTNRIKIASHKSQIIIDLVNSDDAESVITLVSRLIDGLPERKHIRTSGRSVDIFPAFVSKAAACIDFNKRILQDYNDYRILVIGDQGEEGGNDFELLQQRFSLSVDRIHWNPTTCFPVLDTDGSRLWGPAGTINILRHLVIENNGFQLQSY